MSEYTDQIKNQARQVWAVMHGEAHRLGMARQKHPGFKEDGRIIIATVGQFIGTLDKERGWGLDENQKRLIREYLKASGNVVVLNKLEQYKYRIFVKETWNESVLITHPTEQPSRTRTNLTPHDLGKDRPPDEVVHKCADCGKEFTGPQARMALLGHRGSAHGRKRVSASPKRGVLANTSVRQIRVIAYIGGEGGVVKGARHGAVQVICEALKMKPEQVSQVLYRLKARGYFETKKPTPKAKLTIEVKLTDKGKQAYDEIMENHRDLVELPEPEPTVADQWFAVVEEQPATSSTPLSQAEDGDLVTELSYRLTHKSQPDRLMTIKLKRVSGILDLVNQGSISPLEALSRIEKVMTP